MEDNKKPLVVVLSRVYSTGLAIIRSLGAAGYTVDLVASAHKEGTSKIAASSKYVRNAVEVVSKKVKDGEDTALLDEIMKYAGTSEEKIVLFPTDDYTTSIMDQNRSMLEPYFIMPTIVGGGNGVLTHHMDKTVQGELARNANLLTPQEWIISLAEETINIPEDVVYPCFCKPIESITGFKREMAKCETVEELARHLRKLQRKFANRSVLVQEFLEIDSEIDLSGVALDEEIIIPAIIKKTNVAQYDKGVTLAGKVVPFEEIAEIKEQIIELLKSFHYVGMFDMELNIVGDKIYFNEVNLRSGGPNYSYYMSGVNLPALYVKEALGERHTEEEEKVTEFGKQFIYEKVAWQDHIEGFMTKQELDECIANADIKLLNSDEDPVPGQLFMEEIKLKAKKRKLRNKKRAIKKCLRRMKNRIKKWFRPMVYRILGYPQMKKANQRNPEAERPRVMVAGRNYCSNLCMAKSLGDAGYEVEVLRIFQKRPKRRNLMKVLKPDAYSKHIKAFYICVTRRRSKRLVKRLIQLADLNNKMLLIPADDLVAAIVDDYYDELKEYYILPNVNDTAGEVNRLMTKEVQKDLALKAGLPVVKSCVIRTENGEFEIPDSVTYPCFIKPNVSKNSSKSRMRKCESEQELRDSLTEFSRKKDIEMLVEDFVDIAREYSILGVSTKEGVVGPGFFVAEEGGQKEHRGVALIGRLLPVSEQQQLIDDILKFIETLKFDGLYDVDLIETADGKMYFVELNMRFGASGYAVAKAGVNLPGMFADYMIEGKPLDLDCKIAEPGKRFVSEKVLIEEYVKGRISMDKVKSSMDEVDIHFIKDAEDPRPYKHFKKFYTIARVMRSAYIAKEKKATAALEVSDEESGS